ncbi:hypothetical protein Cob_v008747 [Colletotrichum orbiculare MAFF 240422]|uniref:Fun14 family protein n=1 Tax=Colletotrichum orbiculare (strain 104-T / ATCC 96160 / CBS 514.97 / LARS 414 / MAFF 240422) TaxID=1213857 RepID=A0A484FKL4_COLOR|nr:hypothetical protein Cob_v008747 [Colletotrichum orbiculare MAFF 240422]
MKRVLWRRLDALRLVFPVGAGFAATYAFCRRTPLRLDSNHTLATSPAHQIHPRSRRGLSPEAIQQLSTGSVSGLGAGLLVGLLSHALFFVAGMAVFTIYISQRYGLDLLDVVGFRDRLRKVGIPKLFRNAVFRISFAAAFTLAAIARF